MNSRILRGLSKATIAVALLGVGTSFSSNQPLTVQAAKKKAKKVTKKAAKKTAKKASKKTNKKSAKKTSKKIVKKTAKKSTKKVVKKATKKVVKKTAKKSAKKGVKKTTKKAAKKTTPAKKTTKKPAQKVVKVKKVTQADRYTPVATNNVVNLKWGTDLNGYDFSVKDYVTNADKLPYDAKFTLENQKGVNTEHGGTYQSKIVVTYSDGSKDVTSPVTFKVATADADKYTPTYKSEVWVPYSSYSIYDDYIRENILTNPKGYFPNENSYDMRYDLIEKGKTSYSSSSIERYEDGTYTRYLEVRYPDGSYSVVGPIKIHVLPSQAKSHKPVLKGTTFSLAKGQDLSDSETESKVVSSFFTNGSSMPTGTTFELTSSLDTDEPGTYERTIKVSYPDGSTYETDPVTIYVK